MLNEVGEVVKAESWGVTCCQTSVMAQHWQRCCVRQTYRSSSVRRILKWLMFSANCPCFTIGPKNIVGI